ncbi:MAG TPA: glycosyltransferase [Streptosporangiaceae bacterium]|nr:glycosyltransferase [Streptosporangiaceae bacterium]
MPTISVIVPVYGVAGYLPDCLDSILTGDFDIEVIAVDDASPDASGKILDDRAADDPRLRVVHLERNGGQGQARNLALEQATGEYVWFVDGDDALADGALAAVTTALAASKPDVLLINWISSYPDGRTAPNPYASLLPAVPAGGCTLEDQPKLIELTMTSWSKLFRRDFLAGLGVSFADGIHEDIQVTCAALLSADIIAAVDTVCYRYRRERTGSALATTSLGHLAVFDSYRRVFELVASRDAAGKPVSDALRAAIFERAIWHYTTVLQTTGFGVGRIGLPGLVPRAERQRFFQRMHKDFAQYRPASYEHPGGARGAKLRLVERGAYRTYSWLEPLNQARVAVRQLASKR